MKASIIYNSYSGNTRAIAEKVAAATGGSLVEVKSKEHSFRIAEYVLGSMKARKGGIDRIEPAAIDVTSDDLIVIGTPVWADRATPAINGAVEALAGCSGKKAVIFATCGGKGENTISFLKKALEAKGVTVTGEFVFDRMGLKDQGRIDELIARVKSGSNT